MNYEQSLAMEGEGDMKGLQENLQELISTLENYRHSFSEVSVETVSHARGYDDAVTMITEKLREILGDA